MAKTRLNSKFLSQPPASPSRATYKNTVVWRWLQFVIAGDDEVGSAIRAMRKRVDMPNQFPHKTYLLNTYLIRRCKIPENVAVRVHHHLWNLYAQFRDAEKHNASFEPITRGISRNPWLEAPEADVSDDDSQFLSR